MLEITAVVEEEPMLHAAAAGNDYVADGVIGQVDQFGDPVFTKGGTFSAGDNYAFSRISSIVIDHVHHDLYVADLYMSRVLRYPLSVNNDSPSADPDLVIGQPNFTQITSILGGCAAPSQTNFCQPKALAYDSDADRLYISDDSNQRILIYSDASTLAVNGAPADFVLGAPDFVTAGTAATTANDFSVAGMAYDETRDRLFVGDNANHRVLIFNDAALLTDYAAADVVLGADDFTTAGAGVSQSDTWNPVSLGYDSINDRLFVGENTRILQFDDVENAVNHELATRVFGQYDFVSSSEYAGDGSVTGNGFAYVSGLAVDMAGDRLFVTDSQDHRVLVFDDISTSAITGEEADHVLGQPDLTTSTDVGNDSAEKFFVPFSATYEESSDLLIVVDALNGRIRAFNADVIVDQEAGYDFMTGTPLGNSTQGMNGPVGVALDTANHRLFVSDAYSGRILIYDLTSQNRPVDLTPDYVLGHDSLADLTGRILSVIGFIAYDAVHDRLYAVDAYNNRVLAFDTDPLVLDDGDAPILVLGQPDFDTFATGAGATGMSTPLGVEYDEDNDRLFVGDTGNNRVLVFEDVFSDINGAAADLVLGQDDFVQSSSNKGGSTSASGMNAPYDLSYDGASDRLFVADAYNHRILSFSLGDLPNVNGEDATNVLGQPDFVSSATAATQNGLNSPLSVTYDPDGERLFVLDSINSRVLVFSLLDFIDGEMARAVYGQPDFTTVTAGTTQSKFAAPTALEYDFINNNLFVAELFNSRVVWFGAPPPPNTQLLPDEVVGQYDTLGEPTFTRGAAFGQPSRLNPGVATDAIYDSVNHRFFLADALNSRVLVYDLDVNDAFLDTIPDLVIGQPDFVSDGAAVTQEGIDGLSGDGYLFLAYDTNNDRLFVGDNAPRVLVYDVDPNAPGYLDGMAALNVLGQPNFTATGGAVDQDSVNEVPDLEYDAENDRLYVADGARVLVYDLSGAVTDGMLALNVIGQADFDDGLAIVSQTTLSNPRSVAWDPNLDRLFVGDDANRVLIYDLSLGIADGMPASTVLGQQDDNLNLDFFDDSVSGTTQSNLIHVDRLALEFCELCSILFIGDTGNSRVLSFDAGGPMSHGQPADYVIGAPDFDNQADPADVGETYTVAQPFGLAFSWNTSRLAVVDPPQLRTQFFAAWGISPMEEPILSISMMRDGLMLPAGIAVDTVDHRLFVSEIITGRILIYDLDNNNELDDDIADGVMIHSNQHTYLDPDSILTLSLAYDSFSKRLWVADATNNRVVAYDADPLYMAAGDAPMLVLGQPDLITNIAGTDAYTMNGPTGVAFDSNGDRLFVADSDNHRVLVYDTTASIISGAAATYVIGQQDDNINLDYFDDAVGATSFNTLNAPGALVYDNNNNRLFVTDAFNNRITVYDGLAITTAMGADNVLGQDGFNDGLPNRGAAVGPATLNVPYGMSYDLQEDRLIVSDTFNNRSVIYDLSDGIVDGMDAVAVIGQPDLEGNSPATEATRENMFSSLGAVFADHMLYVADTGFHRLQIFDFGMPSSSSSSPGDIYAPQIYNALGQSVAETEAQITWVTNEYSTSFVNYGMDTGYGSSAADYAYVGSHALILSNLTPGATYHFQVCSQDSFANLGCSADNTFTMPSSGEPVIPEVPEEPVAPWIPEETPPTTEPVVPPVEAPWIPEPEAVTPPTEPVTPPAPIAPPTPVVVPPTPPAPVVPPMQPAPSPVVPPTEPSAPVEEPVVPEEVIPEIPATESPSTDSGDGASGPGTDRSNRGVVRLINPGDVEFFAGRSRAPLSLDGITLAVPAGTFITLHLPDRAIFKPIASAWVTIDADSFKLRPTGSFTGEFVSPAALGDHAMNLEVDYVDGTQESVTFVLAVRPPGLVYETDLSGAAVPVSGARVTLLDASGETIAVWDGETYGQANPAVATNDGAYVFLVSAGTYKLQVESPGFGTRTTLAFPAMSMVDMPLELVRLPVEPLDEISFLTATLAVELREARANPLVRQKADAAAVAMLALTALNTAAAGAAAATTIPYLAYLVSLFTQPTQLMNRRRQGKWGTVYHSLSKLPVDLAIVRLMDAATGRVIRSSVTDKEGRYFFITTPGVYRLAVVKAGFVFPSMLLKGNSNDGAHADIITTSEAFEVGADGVIARDIPLDPIGAEKLPSQVVWDDIRRRAQASIGLIAIAVVAGAALLRPTAPVIALVVANVASYLLFRRLATAPVPKRWGRIRDARGKALSSVVVRIFETRYMKLLETQVTDMRGRYAFLVGPNSYAITVEKAGYEKFTRGPIDLTASQEKALNIADDVTLKPTVSAGGAASGGTTTGSAPSGGTTSGSAPVTTAVVAMVLAIGLSGALLFGHGATAAESFLHFFPSNAALSSATTEEPVLTIASVGAMPADGVLGQYDFQGNPVFTKAGQYNASEPALEFDDLFAIELDSVNHHLYAVEEGATRVLRFDLDNNNQPLDTTPDLVFGQPDLSTTDEGLEADELKDPNSLAYDPARDILYIGDQSRILVYHDASETTENAPEADVVLGATDFGIDMSCPALAVNASTFCGELLGLALDIGSDRLYVLDMLSQRVIAFDDVSTLDSGSSATFVVGAPNLTTPGSGAVTQQSLGMYPLAMAFDETNDRLFVGMTEGFGPGFANRVLRFDDISESDNFPLASHVYGQPNFTSNETVVTPDAEHYLFLLGLEVDEEGDRLFVSDTLIDELAENNSGRVLVYDNLSDDPATGALPDHVLGQEDFTAMSFDFSYDVLFEPLGAVYDAANERLLVPELVSARINTFDVSEGFLDGQTGVDFFDVENGLEGTHVGYNFPVGITVDEINHVLYVVDTGSHRVLVYELTSGHELVDLFPDYVIGQPDFDTVTVGTLYTPGDAAVDALNQRLYVTDFDHNRVVVYDVSDLSAVGEPLFALGQPNLATFDPGSDASTMNHPVFLEYSPVADQLFVADQTNNRVLGYDSASSLDSNQPANRVLGQDNFTANQPNRGGGIDSYGLSGADGLAYDESTYTVYVADGGNYRIMAFYVRPGDSFGVGPEASYVLGQPDFTSNTQATSQTELYPWSLAIDEENGRLWAGDVGNNRIIQFNIRGIINGEPAVAVFGQPDFTSNTDYDIIADDSPVQAYGAAYDSVSERLYVSGGEILHRVLWWDVPPPPSPQLLPDSVMGQSGGGGEPSFTRGEPYDSYISAYGPGYHTTDVEYDAVHGRLFVGDAAAARVLVYNLDPETGELLDHKADYVLGQEDFVSYSENVTQNGLESTSNQITMAYDGAEGRDRLFVANGSRVLVFDFAANDLANGMNASYVIGNDSFNEYSEVYLTQSRFSNNIYGLAFDPNHDRLFVSDTERILVFFVSPEYLETHPVDMPADYVLLQDDFTSNAIGVSETRGEYVSHLAYDSTTDRLFAVDEGNSRILVFHVAPESMDFGDGMAASNVLGQDDFTSNEPWKDNDNGYVNNYRSGLGGTGGIEMDAAGQRLFVGDTDRVKIYDVVDITDGEDAVNVLGGPTLWPEYVDGAGLENIGEAAHRLAFNPVSSTLAVVATLNVGFDNTRIQFFDVEDIVDGEAAFDAISRMSMGFEHPNGIALDSVNHRLFVTDANRILVFELDESDELVDIYADRVIGADTVHERYRYNNEDLAPTAYDYGEIYDIEYDDIRGILYAVDAANRRVLAFNVGSSVDDITDGMAATQVIGQLDFTSNTEALSQTGMYYPFALALDVLGDRLFMAENNANRVLVYNDISSKPNGAAANAVIGQASYTSDVVGEDEFGLDMPRGLAYDSNHDLLFVSETQNHRVTVYDVSDMQEFSEPAINVLGQLTLDEVGQNQGAFVNAGTLSNPHGLEYDELLDQLLVVDYSNARSLIYDLSDGIANGMDATQVIGQPDFETAINNNSFTTRDTMDFFTDDSCDEYQSAAFGPTMMYYTDGCNSRVLMFETGASSGGSLGGTGDIYPPTIHEVESAALSSSEQRVTWVTNEASTSIVRYGLSSSYGHTTTEPAFVINHRVSLADLLPGTMYHFQVCSLDSFSNQGCSGDMTFTTPAVGEVVPEIGEEGEEVGLWVPEFDAQGHSTGMFMSGPSFTGLGVTVSDVTRDSVTITWTTDEASGTHVEYGASIPYSHDKVVDGLVTRHTVRLTGLSSGTTYHFRVASQGTDAMRRISEDYTFMTR